MTDLAINDYVDENGVWRYDITGMTRRQMVCLTVSAAEREREPEIEALETAMLETLYPDDMTVTFAEKDDAS